LIDEWSSLPINIDNYQHTLILIILNLITNKIKMQDLLNASKSENLMINNSKRNSFLLTSLELTNTDIIPDDLATNESPINRYNDKSEL
jgi:hypothetical protein